MQTNRKYKGKRLARHFDGSYTTTTTTTNANTTNTTVLLLSLRLRLLPITTAPLANSTSHLLPSQLVKDPNAEKLL